jgi:hypothetical protein
MSRTDAQLSPAELRRCARALRQLADRTRAEAALPKNADRREDMETDAQEAQDLAAKCQRLALPTRR